MLKFKPSVLCCPVLFSEEDELLGTLHCRVSTAHRECICLWAVIIHPSVFGERCNDAHAKRLSLNYLSESVKCICVFALYFWKFMFRVLLVCYLAHWSLWWNDAALKRSFSIKLYEVRSYCKSAWNDECRESVQFHCVNNDTWWLFIFIGLVWITWKSICKHLP